MTLRLRDGGATAELLKHMGYREIDRRGAFTRFAAADGNGADVVDLETSPDAPLAKPGAGPMHHVAFAVPNRDAQLAVCAALAEAGVDVTPVIDRDYFWAIYFRSPDGVLFEVATDEPGFARDENPAHLGEAPRIPEQHAHLRGRIDRLLVPIVD